jgi:hypothetical protein
VRDEDSAGQSDKKKQKKKKEECLPKQNFVFSIFVSF